MTHCAPPSILRKILRSERLGWQGTAIPLMVVGLALSAVMMAMVETARAQELEIVGYVERVRLSPQGGMTLSAKMDSGAKTSSLGASDFQFFQKGDEHWVRFTVTNNKNKSITLEKPVIRTSRIRRSGTEVEERPVVEIGICLGSFFKMGEVNLTARDSMNYNMLIGRRFLSGEFLIDPADKFTQKPTCKKRKGLK